MQPYIHCMSVEVWPNITRRYYRWTLMSFSPFCCKSNHLKLVTTWEWHLQQQQIYSLYFNIRTRQRKQWFIVFLPPPLCWLNLSTSEQEQDEAATASESVGKTVKPCYTAGRGSHERLSSTLSNGMLFVPSIGAQVVKEAQVGPFYREQRCCHPVISYFRAFLFSL